MPFSPRNTALTVGVALAIAALGACHDDTSKPIGDVLAQDSTLNLAVMSAGGSSSAPAGDTNVATMTTSTAPAAAMPAAPVTAKPHAVKRQRVNHSARLIRMSVAREPVAPVRRSERSARVTRIHAPNKSSVAIAPAPRASTVITDNAVPARVVASAAHTAVIPAGSSLSLLTDQKICTSSAKVGDRFDARLVKEIVGPSGVVIPAGTSATGEIRSLPNNDSRMSVAIQSIDFGGRSYPVGSQVTYTEMEKVRIQPAGSTTSRVLAGAGIGAILGRVLGGNSRSTIIGAAGGAAAGAVIANRGVRYDECVPNGGQIVARLTQPLKVQLGE